jgi:hypothetical protein
MTLLRGYRGPLLRRALIPVFRWVCRGRRMFVPAGGRSRHTRYIGKATRSLRRQPLRSGRYLAVSISWFSVTSAHPTRMNCQGFFIIIILGLYSLSSSVKGADTKNVSGPVSFLPFSSPRSCTKKIDHRFPSAASLRSAATKIRNTKSEIRNKFKWPKPKIQNTLQHLVITWVMAAVL